MIAGLLRLMRLYYSLPMTGGFAVIATYLLRGHLQGQAATLAWACAALFCMISGGYVLNDVVDMAVDQVNCPERALCLGIVNRSQALTLAVLLLTTGVVLGFLCRARFGLGSLVVGALLVVYDLYSKRIGFFKDILVAGLMTSLYPLAFLLFDHPPHTRIGTLYIHPTWLFLTALGYEMLKDVRDHIGDQHVAPEGIARWSQKRSFCWAAKIVIALASFITLLPYALGYCGHIYLTTAVVAIVLALTAASMPCRKALPLVYAEVALITAGSLADLLWQA